jgi:carbonic anhydrase/acetyltransferase-like protein (isoleucine patch superfamily)
MLKRFGEIKPKLADQVFVADSALVQGDVEIGPGSSVWYGTVIRGDVHYIRIGSQTNIQDRCVVHVTRDTWPTIVGDRVTVGHGAILHGCRVANDVLIGMGAIVLDDVDVLEGSVVAAGALLPPGKKYPAGSLIVGSPGTVRRIVSDEERRWIENSASHYCRLAREHAAIH